MAKSKLYYVTWPRLDGMGINLNLFDSMKPEHYSETAQFLTEIADRLRKLRGEPKL